ncbi:hypothetical protein C4580_04895 [Candidatus Woesearchaeota archaeon]|nr:MAG: hypothetical protein C4580_04895 [Candidatus Woesearchaeota archaeon]
MAKQLTPQEKEHLFDIERNFDSKIAQYTTVKKRELSEGKKTELEKELRDLEHYLALVSRGEADDILSNIRFIQAKARALKKLLQTNSSDS